ncbi:hypothetical protein ACFJI0_11525 [Hydrogenophaga sp. UC242_53]|uniref:hypothetical protein n=1 Tax=Hydrogenophaga sp. UC242_53 TaxID=3350170 RepID=UPI0036D221A1
MSGAHFSADWLQQREPFDTAARDEAARHLQLAARFHAMAPPAGTPWRVIDLGCGTGANQRWLAPRLGGPQQWLVVDHDAALLRGCATRRQRPGFRGVHCLPAAGPRAASGHAALARGPSRHRVGLA